MNAASVMTLLPASSPVRVQRRSDLCATACADLRSEFLFAVERAPWLVVRTPGYGPGVENTVIDVIADHLSSDENVLQALVCLVRDAAAGRDVHLRAAAWLAERANEHAKWHCDDLATLIEEGA